LNTLSRGLAISTLLSILTILKNRYPKCTTDFLKTGPLVPKRSLNIEFTEAVRGCQFANWREKILTATA
jgi:hypothetical protein